VKEGANKEPRPMEPEPPVDLPPTLKFQQYHYVFWRDPKDQEDRAQRISAQKHELIITNNPGANLAECLLDPEAFSKEFNSLINAQNIILVLGIPEEDYKYTAENRRTENMLSDEIPPSEESFKNQVQKPLSLAAGWNWSMDTYYQFILMLLNHIGNGQRRNIAVCMTKVDQLGYLDTPWDMLQLRHGPILVDLLRQRKQFHNIEVFATSSAGYIQKDGSWVPNFDNGGLLKPDLWKPVNTAQPFYWIFEQIELERVRKGFILFRSTNLRKYIHYPEATAF
jgi:hypothetical protein